MAVHIHRLKRTDNPTDNPILLHITQSQPSKPLDLKLIATEHEHLYHGEIQESSLPSLQAPTYTGSLPEWKSILKHLLLHEKQQQPPTSSTSNSSAQPLAPSPLQGLETVASITTTKTLTITLRKNIKGITQRLGTLTLHQDDEREEVSPFDWLSTALSQSDALRAELAVAQESLAEQRGEVGKLQRQLEDLGKAKRRHEGELVKKFVLLLNEKKGKVRELMRVIEGGKKEEKVVVEGGGGVAEEVGSARGGSGGRRGGRKKSGASRGGKRKVDEVENVGEEEEGDDGEEEGENGAEGKGEVLSEDDEELRLETPPRSADEEEEETEDEDALDFPSKTNASAGGGGSGGGNKAKGKPDATTKSAGVEEMDVDDDQPPPRRELPFAVKDFPPSTTRSSRATAAAAAAASATNDDDDDDEETDDEL